MNLMTCLRLHDIATKSAETEAISLMLGTEWLKMNCPLCNKESNLYAETKPNGKIGIFCRRCQKGYYTTNPEDGWEIKEYTFAPPKDLAKREAELAKIHNIDMNKEMLYLAEKEFEVFITGEWKL